MREVFELPRTFTNIALEVEGSEKAQKIADI